MRLRDIQAQTPGWFWRDRRDIVFVTRIEGPNEAPYRICYNKFGLTGVTRMRCHHSTITSPADLTDMQRRAVDVIREI